MPRQQQSPIRELLRTNTDAHTDADAHTNLWQELRWMFCDPMLSWVGLQRHLLRSEGNTNPTDESGRLYKQWLVLELYEQHLSGYASGNLC